MGRFNQLIHQPARLRIMAALTALGKGDELEFTALRKLLQLSDGNLGAHLLKLERAGYVRQRKTFVRRKPCTYIRATAKGRAAFEEHVEALRDVLGE